MTGAADESTRSALTEQAAAVLRPTLRPWPERHLVRTVRVYLLRRRVVVTRADGRRTELDVAAAEVLDVRGGEDASRFTSLPSPGPALVLRDPSGSPVLAVSAVDWHPDPLTLLDRLGVPVTHVRGLAALQSELAALPDGGGSVGLVVRGRPGPPPWYVGLRLLGGTGGGLLLLIGLVMAQPWPAASTVLVAAGLLAILAVLLALRSLRVLALRADRSIPGQVVAELVPERAARRPRHFLRTARLSVLEDDIVLAGPGLEELWLPRSGPGSVTDLVIASRRQTKGRKATTPDALLLTDVDGDVLAALPWTDWLGGDGVERVTGLGHTAGLRVARGALPDLPQGVLADGPWALVRGRRWPSPLPVPGLPDPAGLDSLRLGLVGVLGLLYAMLQDRGAAILGLAVTAVVLSLCWDLVVVAWRTWNRRPG